MIIPKHRLMRWIFNIYPPYLGAGVRVRHISPDFRQIDVEMLLRFWNQNYVRTQFGGSLYSMTDPFLMLMLMENLGRDYIVWDKKATIQYKKPGTGSVFAKFSLSEIEIDSIRHEADNNYKYEPKFIVNVTNKEGDVVAEVEKTIYVRRKDRVNNNKSDSSSNFDTIL
jgi:hypothetical protein